MSATTNVPPVETTPHPEIAASTTPLDVANVMLNNPTIKAAIMKYAGDPNGMPATLAGLVIGYATTTYGLKLDPALAGPLTLVVAAALGFGWNWLSARFLTPATPVTQGTMK